MWWDCASVVRRMKLDFVEAASVLRGGQLRASDGGGNKRESSDRSVGGKVARCAGDIQTRAL